MTQWDPTLYAGYGAAQAKAIERQIARFERPAQKRLRKMARIARPLGDLILSHPAAAFAIATVSRPAEATGAAVRAVREGAPLKAVSALLGAPYWTRWLPPEAFRTALPPLNASADFARRIGSMTPRGAAETPARGRTEEGAAMWLAWLARALGPAPTGADEAVALWLAKQPIYFGRALHEDAATAFVAFAGDRRGLSTGLGRGRGRGFQPWRDKANLATMAEQLGPWFASVIGEHCVDPNAGAGWRRGLTVNRVQVSPVLTAEALHREARALSNCLGDYVNHVRAQRCLIYVMKLRGKAIAAVELKAREDGRGGVAVSQFYGPANAAPCARAEEALLAFLGAQTEPCPLVASDRIARSAVDAVQWRILWAPLLERRPDVETLFGAPTDARLTRLQAAVEAFREAGGRIFNARVCGA